MAHITYIVRKGNIRKDGLYSILWRVTNNGKCAYRNTGLFISKDKVNFKCRDKMIMDAAYRKLLDEQLDERLLKVAEITRGHNRHMHPADILKRLELAEEGVNPDFFDYFYKTWLKEKEGTIVTKIAVSAIHKFQGFVKETTGSEKLPFLNINSKLMTEFDNTLTETHVAKEKYPMYISRIYNDMRDKYNDYDEDYIVLPNKILNWKKHRPKITADLPDKSLRTLTVENIRAIANMEFDDFDCEVCKAMVEAREVFLLSFCLMGINPCDMWKVTSLDGGTIKYARRKTKEKTEAVIPRQLSEIYEKYRDKDGERVFCFYKRFKTEIKDKRTEHQSYFHRINRGLKQLAMEMGIKPFTMYAARHTAASIAGNELRIAWDTIDSRDNINEISKKLTDYVFGDTIIKTFNFKGFLL